MREILEWICVRTFIYDPMVNYTTQQQLSPTVLIMHEILINPTHGYVFTSCLEKQGMLSKHTKFVPESKQFSQTT